MKHRATLLAVDEDENTRTIVKDFLEGEGYKVVTSRGGKALFDKLKASDPDLILLDVILPEKDGLSLIKKIKELTYSPLIIISQKRSITDKIIGLEVGADDYLGKPLNLKELAARIKAHLRLVESIKDALASETSNRSPDIIRFGKWALDRKRHEVRNNKKKQADLTAGEFKLLEALALAPNRVLSREQLFEMTRADDYESFDRAIDVQIARIRKKIDDDPHRPKYIETVRGVGYMLKNTG